MLKVKEVSGSAVPSSDISDDVPGVLYYVAMYALLPLGHSGPS